MAGFQNFTPRTANLARVWEGFNPSANFLGGMKAVQQMDLDRAAEERLRESAEVDRMIKTTMLPYEERLANAKIGEIMARANLLASRAEQDARGASEGAWLEQLMQGSYDQIKGGGAGAADATQSNMSLGGSPDTGFSRTSLSADDDVLTDGPLSFAVPSDSEAIDDLFSSLPDGMSQAELTDPKYALASNPSGGMSTDAPPNAEAMQVLERRKMEEKKPTSFVSSEQANDLKNIRSELYKGENPLMNMPEIQAREREKEEGKLGNFLTSEIAYVQSQRDLAESLPNKNPNKAFYSARASVLGTKLSQEVSKRYGIEPTLVPRLLYSGRGVIRSGDEINQIYDAMKSGTIDVPGAGPQPVRSFEEAEEWVGKLRAVLPKQQELNTEKYLTSAKEYNDAVAVYKENQSPTTRLVMEAARRKLGEAMPLADRQRMLQQNGRELYQKYANENFFARPKEGEASIAEQFQKDFYDESSITANPTLTVGLLNDGNFNIESSEEDLEKFFKSQGFDGIPSEFVAGAFMKSGDTTVNALIPAKVKYKDGKFSFNPGVPMDAIKKSLNEAANKGDRETPDAPRGASSAGQVGLKARETVLGANDFINKSFISGALDLANIGPGLYNAAMATGDAASAALTGDASTSLPRYRLYDRNDVEEVYSKLKNNPLKNFYKQ